jgi:hypothetical protein
VISLQVHHRYFQVVIPQLYYVFINQESPRERFQFLGSLLARQQGHGEFCNSEHNMLRVILILPGMERM